MDYMDPSDHCTKKANKLNLSLTHLQMQRQVSDQIKPGDKS